jgi:hypothetical protein
MPKYELQRKPNTKDPSEFTYFFVVDGHYHLAARYKTDEEGKKWFDLCRQVFVEPIETKIKTRMLNGKELYLQERKLIDVDQFNLTYYYRYQFHVMYGSECVQGFYTYSPNANVYEQKLAEAIKYFDEYVYVEPTSVLEELTTLIVEDTN